MRARSRLASLVARLGIALYAVPVVTAGVVLEEWNRTDLGPRDSLAYYHAATATRAGLPLYDPPAEGPHEFVGQWPYIYPPPLAAFLSLAPATDYRTFDRAWLLLNVLAFWVLAACLARLAGGHWSSRGTMMWGGLLYIFPFAGALLSIHFANIDLMILALVAAGLAVPRLSGLALGCAAAFKIFPLWPLGVLVIRRPRTVLPGLALAVAICAAACIAVFGLGGTYVLARQWVSEVAPSLSQGQFWGESLENFKEADLTLWNTFSNFSISFLPVQLAVLWGWDYDGGDLPAVVRLLLTGFSLVVPAVAVWYTRKRPPCVQAAIVFIAALFAAAIVRPYVLPVILLLIATWLKQRRLASAGDSPATAQ